MSVEFQEEDVLATTRPKPKKVSLLTRTLIKIGIAKDEASAQRLFLIIAGTCLVAALLIFANLFGIL